MELVEREGVLTELDSMLTEVGQGYGRLALVSGEAGIGKTAVVERFCRVHSDGVRVLVGGCDPLATPRPLGPLADIAVGVGGELDRLLDEGTDPTPLFHMFVRVLNSSGRPTVVVLEDMHWADQATLDLLCFLGRRVAQTRALVVVTFRDDEVEADHPLRVAVGNLPVAPVVRRLRLQPLSHDGVAALARGKRLDPARLLTLSGGNPFFLTELLAAEDGELPETVRDAVLARASRLSEPARADLDVLAAVARPVARPHLTELRIVSGYVDEGVSRGLLRWEQGRVGFRHELGRTAVLGAIPPVRAVEIHDRVLAALRSRAEGKDAAELAYHAEAAGDEAAVLEYAPAAALEAERLSAHREAAAQWARTLRFAQELPTAQRADLYRAHSREAHFSADVEGAIASARAELELRRALGDPLQIGRALYWLSLHVWFTEDFEEALPLAREAVSVLAAQPPSAQLATAYVTLASTGSNRSTCWDGCGRDVAIRRLGNRSMRLWPFRRRETSCSTSAMFAPSVPRLPGWKATTNAWSSRLKPPIRSRSQSAIPGSLGSSPVGSGAAERSTSWSRCSSSTRTASRFRGTGPRPQPPGSSSGVPSSRLRRCLTATRSSRYGGRCRSSTVWALLPRRRWQHAGCARWACAGSHVASSTRPGPALTTSPAVSRRSSLYSMRG
jgi:hypothetical protein